MMKQMLLFLVFFFFSLSQLEAVDTKTDSYSIVVGAFSVQQGAKRILNELESKLTSNPEILTLQSENGFDYVLRSSGKYHLVAIEPIVGKGIMKSVLAATKEHYRDAYPKRVKMKVSKTKKVADAKKAAKAKRDAEIKKAADAKRIADAKRAAKVKRDAEAKKVSKAKKVVENSEEYFCVDFGPTAAGGVMP